MRTALKLGLVVTCLLSVAALWPTASDLPRHLVVAAVERPESGALATAVSTLKPMQPTVLPAVLPVQVFEAASRDVFAPVERPAPPAPKQILPPAVAFSPSVAPPAMAPPLTYRFFGRMSTPDGQTLVLLARGEQVFQIAVGTVLDDGYRVDAIQDDRVQLSFQPLGVVVELPIPPVLGS